MANRDVIAQVLIRTLNASRLTQVRKLSAAHENLWKEMLNGSTSSQRAADEKLSEVVVAAVAEIDNDSIEYILRAIK